MSTGSLKAKFTAVEELCAMSHQELVDLIEDREFKLAQITELAPADRDGDVNDPPESYAPDVGANLQRMHQRLLGVMYWHRGRTVTKHSLLAAMYWDRSHDDWPDNLKIVNVQVSRLRNRLTDIGSDLEIERVWGVGYRLKADDFKEKQPV